METNGPTNPVWNMSGDFTENQQASKVFKHVIEGDYDHLKVEVSSIIRSSIDLQQLCRIVTPTDLLYQQQTNHLRRQSCPILFNPTNQLMAGNRRLSIPSNTNLVTIPQNMVVSGVPIVQPQILDTTTQLLQNAAVNPLAKPATIGNSFVAQPQLAQPVVQQVKLASPVQPSTVTAAAVANPAAAAAAQLQNTVSLPKPVGAANTISVSPAQASKATIPLNTITDNTIQSAVAAVPLQATATATAVNTAANVINPLAATNVATTLASNDLATQSITKNNGLIVDNLNIMNGAQLAADTTTDVLNFINTDTTNSTLVDNSLTTLGSNLTLPTTDTTTFDLSGIDENLFLNLDKNFM